MITAPKAPPGRLPLACAVALAAAGGVARGGVITSTWVGPAAGGLFTNPANWNPAIVPTNGGGHSFLVVLGSAPPAEVIAPLPVALDGLTIGAGSTLRHVNGAGILFEAGAVTNDGAWRLEPADASQDIVLFTDQLDLSGTGTLDLGAAGKARVYGIAGIRRLVNHAGHTIRGTGNIGQDGAFALTNEGVIEASGPFPLDLAARSSTNVNAGTLRAAPGGHLVLHPPGFDNEAGELVAQDGGVVSFGPSAFITTGTISGGLFRTEGSGKFIFDDPWCSVSGGIFEGTFATLAGVTTSASPPPILIGTWTLGEGAGGAKLNASGTFAGSGEVILTGASGSTLDGSQIGSGLTVFPGILIRGSGSVVGPFTNYSEIRAEGAPGLTLSASGSATANSNSGLLRAATGSSLTIAASFTNIGGQVLASSGSVVALSGGEIVGGSITAEPNSEVRCVGAQLDDPLLGGTIRVPAGSSLTLVGVAENNGLIWLDAVGQTTSLVVTSNATLTLGGTGTLKFAASSLGRITGSTTSTFVNAATHTIRGAGKFGNDAVGVINNQGTIVADKPPGLTIDPKTSFSNSGTIHVTAAGSLTASPGTWTNSGLIAIDAGRTMTRTGDITQVGGETHVDGTLSFVSGQFVANGGLVTGAGLLQAALTNGGGTVLPGPGAATLGIGGAFTQGAAGTLQMDVLGDAEFDVLAVTGAAALNGTLHLVKPAEYQPGSEQEFVVLTAASVTGTFSQVLSDAPVEVTYLAGAVRVRFLEPAAAPPLLGDLDHDGRVGGADLGLLLAAWGECVQAACEADLNADGLVDGLDLGVLLAQWKGAS